MCFCFVSDSAAEGDEWENVRSDSADRFVSRHVDPGGFGSSLSICVNQVIIDANNN